MNKSALLIIDMQNDFFRKKEIINQKETLIKNINEIIDFSHGKNIPVIWIRQILKVDLSDSPKHIKSAAKGIVIEGTLGSELVEGLTRAEEDYEVIKTRYSGFFKTNLEYILKELNVDTLIICGVNTHACVRMTAIDAWQRDYDVIIAKDCVGSYDQEHHEISIKYFEPVIAKVKSNTEIKDIQL